jgi:hypothetical protein
MGKGTAEYKKRAIIYGYACTFCGALGVQLYIQYGLASTMLYYIILGRDADLDLDSGF